MPNGKKIATPAFTPAHIAAFGTSRMFGGYAPLFKPEPEEGDGRADANGGMTRAQFVQEEKARQLDKGIEYLAQKNAELQFDLNRARAAIPEGHVTLPKEDAAALSAYREAFPTPKEAKEAKGTLGTLREKDELRSYDDARTAALSEYGADLPDNFKALIPTAEQLKDRPGGLELLRNTDFMRAEVERVATAYGAVKQDATERTDVGDSPATVTAGADKGKTNEAREAASTYYDRLYPDLKPQKEQ